MTPRARNTQAQQCITCKEMPAKTLSPCNWFSGPADSPKLAAGQAGLGRHLDWWADLWAKGRERATDWSVQMANRQAAKVTGSTQWANGPAV